MRNNAMSVQDKLPVNVEALQDAIRLLGGIRKTARALGCTESTIRSYIREQRVKAVYLPKLEKLTNGRVRRHELSPELFRDYRYVGNRHDAA